MIAQAQVVESAREMPPGERAFEVYRLIEVVGLSTRAAAQQIGLSQTRVVQLRNSVESWVARQPNASAGLTKQQRVQAAEYKAGLRLDHLYSLALEAFRQSQGPEIVSEEGSGGARTITTKLSQGNTRYLQMAMRIAAQQSRIPLTPIACDCGDEAELSVRQADPVMVSPPEEDCSPASAEQSPCAEATAKPLAAKAAATSDCSKPAKRGEDASHDFASDLFPVQTDIRVDPLDSLEEPVLTRKQRKRRARMLAALRKEVGFTGS